MEFAKLKKAAILLVFGIISSIFANNTYASVTWLSSINGTDAPTGVAVDGKGNIYVAESRGKDRISVFNRKGLHIRTLAGMSNPRGVAVDSNYRVYVANAGTGSAAVYNADFTLAFKLGKGEGEFKYPVGVAVSANGFIFVSDRDDHAVKVFSQDGKLVKSFGSQGTGDGQFNKPLGLAVDDARGELYILDRALTRDATNTVNAMMEGARIQVYDLAGNFLRSLGQFAPSKMKSPVGVAVDGSGNLYVTDTAWPPVQALHVLTNTGTMIETIADSAHALKGPLGAAIGRDKRLFVASLNGKSIQVYGLDGYTTMDAAEAAPLAFTAQEGGPNPASMPLSISNSGSGTLEWTVAAATQDGNSWLVPQASGSTGPNSSSTANVSVDVVKTGLPAGTYSGTLTVTAASGAEEKVNVSLTVTPPPGILSVAPQILSYKAQQNGRAPLSQTVTVANLGGGNMTWTAAASADWLKLIASSSSLIVSPETAALPAGKHSGTITITAPGATFSPMAVAVTVDVVQAGTVKVKTNKDDAPYAIAGPTPYKGAGAWSSDEMKPGDYTITFGKALGWVRPTAQKFVVTSGEAVEIVGNYRKKASATHIITGSTGKNALITVQPLNGDAPASFSPFKDGNVRVRVAAGDLDASGLDKIAATDSKRTIKVFSVSGVELASYQLADTFEEADVTVGDLDNDGNAEILVGAEGEGRVVKIFSYAANALQEKATLFTEDKDGAFSVALGDVNDDGMLEVLIGDDRNVRAFAVQKDMTLGRLWTRSGDFGHAPQVAAGDINGDGIAEVAVSYESSKEKTTRIRFLKGTGEDYGMTIEPFRDLAFNKASSVVLGDTDGNGYDEIVAGAGPAGSNDPMVKIFDSNGEPLSIRKVMDGKFGVNVGLGKFQ